MMKTILIIILLLIIGGVIWAVKRIFNKDPDDEWRGWR